MHLTRSLRDRQNDDSGFTLIELVVTVAIMGFIAAALTGVVISYLKTTMSTSARLTESHDVQFAAAYWQRDVASIGVRSTTYDSSPSVHSFPLLQSVNTSPACSLPSGTKVATLAWSSYTVANPDTPDTVTVSYVAQPSGTHYSLVRRRCTGSTVNSTITVADNLTAVPVLACPGAASGCTGTGGNVPLVVTLTMTSSDPDNNDGSTYAATLTGERRET